MQIQRLEKKKKRSQSDCVRKLKHQQQSELFKPLESVMRANQMQIHSQMKQLALMYTYLESAEHCCFIIKHLYNSLPIQLKQMLTSNKN